MRVNEVIEVLLTDSDNPPAETNRGKLTRPNPRPDGVFVDPHVISYRRDLVQLLGWVFIS